MFSPVTQYETIDGKKHDTAKLAKEHSENLICENLEKMLISLVDSGKLTKNQIFRMLQIWLKNRISARFKKSLPLFNLVLILKNNT